MDEFGRVRPNIRAHSPSPQSCSKPRDRRRLGRREERRERKQRNREQGGGGNVTLHDEQEYKRSLWPPGTELSKYSFDEILNWYVTPNKVWWYRPDLTLWYDCRSESYYSYDSGLGDYVPVAAEVAKQALATGVSVAPQDSKAANEAAIIAEAAAATSLTMLEAVEVSIDAEVAAATTEIVACDPRNGHDEVRLEAMPQATPEGGGLDAEDKVAIGLCSHTESWQGKKDSQEDRYIEGVRMGKLGTAYGVFDGHGGVLAAEFAMKHLPKNVARCYEQQRVTTKCEDVDPKRMLSAMEEAFPLTDRELLQLARRKGFADGTTALILIIAGNPCLSPIPRLCFIPSHSSEAS